MGKIEEYRKLQQELEIRDHQEQKTHNDFMLSVNMSLNSFKDTLDEFKQEFKQQLDFQDCRRVSMQIAMQNLEERIDKKVESTLQLIGKSVDKFYDEMEQIEKSVNYLEISTQDKLEHANDVQMLKKCLDDCKKSIDSCLEKIDMSVASIKSLLSQKIHETKKDLLGEKCKSEPIVVELSKKIEALDTDVRGLKELEQKDLKQNFVNKKNIEALHGMIKILKEKIQL